MNNQLTLYTGIINYKEIEFSFAFDMNELRLIPPQEKRHVVEWDWGMKQIGEGAFTFADPIPVEETFIIGQCNETRQNIIFIPKRGSTLSLHNYVVRIELMAYIICKADRSKVDRVSFSCPEINYIFPVNQVFHGTTELGDFTEKGIVGFATKEFDATISNKECFHVDNKAVNAYFSIYRQISTRITEPPLSAYSVLMFEFEPTDDYGFIVRLWQIAKKYISFLCYRKNIYIPQINLDAPDEGGKHYQFATMYLLGQDGAIETDTLQKGRYIKHCYIMNHEGAILTDIASEKLYLRHLPDTYRMGRSINEARFVMIMAAFEWEFHRIYPTGIRKSDATIVAENAVLESLQKIIEKTHGKEKEIYKFLSKLVGANALKSEIVQIGNDLSNIIDSFGNHLYHLNNEELKYSEMGDRLANQRNHFAHGDLDKDFIGLSLLDLIFLECVIYSMQLKYYGIEDLKIKKAVNELFHFYLAIK